jgi:glutamine cyclotransferase
VRRIALALLVATLPLFAACQQDPVPLEAVVQARYPHDPEAFTQGLVFADGRFYESTGLYGESSLREVIPESGEVLRSLPLDARYFGEGLALADDRLIQLTWRSGVAFVWDADTFEQLDTFRYETEGWGLCFDGEELWMSDGSATLVRRDPDTFAIRGRVDVTNRGEPVALLNELECVGEHVYANVWQTDTIVRIHKDSGRVAATIDAGGLLTTEERAALNAQAVLNGIAWDPETERFWLTGKLWPALFEVEFAPTDAAR